MANTRELRRRIKSVKNTAQITKAMQMVAATKMRKAQNQAVNGRPYSLNLSRSLKRLLPLVQLESHQLLQSGDVKKVAVIILSTDKSLCGSLNTNLFRMLTQSGLLSPENSFITVGKKGRNFIARLGKNLVADFENLDTITFRQATLLSKLIIDAFLNKEVGQVYLTYPHFGSALRQEPTKLRLLPIQAEDIIEYLKEEAEKETSGEYLFEPNPAQLLDYILAHYIQIKIYQALLETKASEHSARMIAMQNATDNALELVDDLNLAYNQTRQDSITKELLEITTASLAMS
ncbi:ATP synthase F1 subunit gamma [Candidatus Daviesbacteria bacterium]|nr:ATP synthase F1 subunit gamma [Candidatus Daviesbacteria bacterium]